jgi:hypothetical protein
LQLVNQLLAEGYEVQNLQLDGETALVGAIRTWPTLEALTLTRATGQWEALAVGAGD